MSNRKKPYIISIWKDTFNEKTKQIEENQIAIIGSNDMTSKNRAVLPVLTSNINGTNTLSFSLYDNYLDDNNNKIHNFFVDLINNETKIKLKFENKWYDFIVKTIQEDSSKHIHSYIATDLYVNELSKNGYNLVFDDKLENSLGTAQELAEKTLENTDWQVGKGDIIHQYDIKPLQLATVHKENVIFQRAINPSTETNITLSPGQFFYVFYLGDNNQKDSIAANKLQCILSTKPGEQIQDTTEILSKQDYPIYEINSNQIFDIGSSQNINTNINKTITNIRAYRLVKFQESGYDPKIDEYYTLYSKNGVLLRNFQKVRFINVSLVLDLISNNKDFETEGSWWTQNLIGKGLECRIFPLITKDNVNTQTEFKSYLNVDFKTAGEIYNTGLTEKRSSLEGLFPEKEYLFRIKYHSYKQGESDVGALINEGDKSDKYHIYYEEWDNLEKKNISIANFKYEKYEEGYNYYTVTFPNGCSKKELLNHRFKFGIMQQSANNPIIAIEELNFFEKNYDKNGQLIYPDRIINEGDKGLVHVENYMYNPLTPYENKEDLKYEFVGEIIPDNYIPFYTKEYEKKRTLKISKSNRFNILQTIGEIFEAFPIFEILHEENGKIKYINGKPCKYVYFKEFLKDSINNAGFKKGINLVSTTRNIISDNIVTKTIVQQNSNEFAPKGFCSIVDAKENYSKENVIYNFDYYINKGLVDNNALNTYLYTSTGQNTDGSYQEGMYTQLRKINFVSEQNIKTLETIDIAISKLEANLKVYEEAVNNAENNLRSALQDLYNFCAYNTLEQVPNDSNLWKDNKFIEIATLIKANTNFKDDYSILRNNVEKELIATKAEDERIRKELTEASKQKKKLHDNFFNRYSRIIQEGVWSSEDYYDADLYYLDAEQIGYTSSFPNVTYNMSVIELSQLDEFKYYTFSIGERTYVEDIDFFGWDYTSEGKIPHKQEVLITSIVRNLDQPKNNTITIQNYRTKFQELFQKVVATTQSLRFKEGGYDKVSNSLNPNGTIKVDTLQNSFENNSLIIQNAKDQSVTWGDNGITVRNLSKPNEILRIVSGGVMISTNGGENYQSAIRGSGINAKYITTGNINASKINILSSSNTPAFRWDEYGLNAYQTTGAMENNDYTISLNKFVRFDSYGLYGLRENIDDNQFNPNSPFTQSDPGNPLERIKQKADFGLLWDGFFLKNKKEGTGIEISTENDILISQENSPRIKIGLLIAENDDSNKYYGIRFKNAKQETTLDTNDKGELSLLGRLHIGNNNCHVNIGYLKDKFISSNEDIKAIIDANNNFIVYENGYVKALEGEFEGKIVATEGQIGSMIINPIDSDEDALVIKNNNFSIQDKQGNKLLFFNSNPEEGEPSLKIMGNSSISGIIEATSGTFNGVINAQSGSIGGFNIKEHEISTDGLVLYSNDGTGLSKIVVDNIDLKSGAKITEYIKLVGKDNNNPVYIKNPDYEMPQEGLNKDIFIKSGNLSLNNKGIITLGEQKGNEIIINGQNENPYIAGPHFNINGNISYFENINVAGKIVSTIFETGRVQNVGGAMVFRPSFRILNRNSYIDNGTLKLQITIEGKGRLKKDDIIYLVKSTNYLEDITQEIYDFPISKVLNIIKDETADTSILQLSTLYNENDKYESIILMKGINDQSCLFGINSEGSKYSFLHPQGITLSSAYNDDLNNYQYQTHLFLGNLSKLDLKAENNNVPFETQGYGLYCDNVYLNGSLVTTTGNKYAGVSTNPLSNETTSIINTGINNIDEHGSIVFWAGANSTKLNDIDNAPFKVHQDGSCYTKQMKIEDSIFTNGVITGARLIAATIEGNDGKEGEGRLNIIDTGDGIKNGIYFKQKIDEEKSLNTISLHSTGFKYYNTVSNDSGYNFIEINKNEKGIASINFVGEKGTFITKNNNKIQIDGRGIEYINNNEIKSNINLNSNDVILNSTNTRIKSINTIIENEIFIKNDKSYEMNYKPVEGGYDLYIYEKKGGINGNN